MKFPDGFHRTDGSNTADLVNNAAEAIFEAHPMQPGGKNGKKVNTYTFDPNSANFTEGCKLYADFVNNLAVPLYPNPQGILRTNLNANLGFLGSTFAGCPQVFPYGH
ncbi:hypothetical protein M422DRAFT_247225 [Sphaerobolus stellatus SS14]|nr:hypothetical protein M422DRAFT_247225 [Sphaerobolus stellatus SS14]